MSVHEILNTSSDAEYQACLSGQKPDGNYFGDGQTWECIPPALCAGSGDLGTAECQPPVVCPEATAEDQSCVPFTYYEPVCHEDMDCWDCETMGNLICGPTTTIASSVPIPDQAPILPVTGVELAWFVLAGSLLIAAGALLGILKLWNEANDHE